MAQDPNTRDRPHETGITPFKKGPSGLKNLHPFDWQIAAQITKRMCEGEYLINIVKEYGMTLADTDSWSKKKPKFAEWLARARKIQTENFMEQSIKIFDDDLPTEEIPTKNGVIERPSMAGVQNRIAKSKAMQTFAARWNREQFGEGNRVQDALDLFSVLSAINTKQEKPIKQTNSKTIDV